MFPLLRKPSELHTEVFTGVRNWKFLKYLAGEKYLPIFIHTHMRKDLYHHYFGIHITFTFANAKEEEDPKFSHQNFLHMGEDA